MNVWSALLLHVWQKPELPPSVYPSQEVYVNTEQIAEMRRTSEGTSIAFSGGWGVVVEEHPGQIIAMLDRQDKARRMDVSPKQFDGIVERLRERVEALESVLREVEWGDNHGGISCCPCCGVEWCGTVQPPAHAEGCALAAELAESRDESVVAANDARREVTAESLRAQGFTVPKIATGSTTASEPRRVTLVLARTAREATEATRTDAGRAWGTTFCPETPDEMRGQRRFDPSDVVALPSFAEHPHAAEMLGILRGGWNSECNECADKPGSPTLCASCLRCRYAYDRCTMVRHLVEGRHQWAKHQWAETSPVPEPPRVDERPVRYVLARDHGDFWRWTADHPGQRLVYVDSADVLRGLSIGPADVDITPEFDNRRDSSAIRLAMALCNRDVTEPKP